MSDLSDSKNDDVLANEVSVGLEVSGVPKLPIEVKGKAKSRFVSAFDRLLGNIVDFPNAWLEAAPAKKRAKTAREVEAIKQGQTAIAQRETAAARRIGDPAVRQAVQQFVAEAVRNQDKKILLLQETIEELEKNPPNAEEAAQGSEQLDEGFLNRLSKHTEEATEADIRDKWSKVLAGEIRKPGTFSSRVLRIIDEIEPETAKLFEKVCAYRIEAFIPKCLLGELSVAEQVALEDSGLVIPQKFPGLSIPFVNAEATSNGSQKSVWILRAGNLALSIPKDEQRATNSSDIISFTQKDLKAPGVGVYPLTKAGKWLSSSCGDKQDQAFYAYLRKLSEAIPDIEITEYHIIEQNEGKKLWEQTKVWKNGKPLELKFYPYEGYSY